MLPQIDRENGFRGQQGDIAALKLATEFYSDGTLGKYGAYDNLARGGWGVCALDAHGNLIGAIYGSLDG